MNINNVSNETLHILEQLQKYSISDYGKPVIDFNNIENLSYVDALHQLMVGGDFSTIEAARLALVEKFKSLEKDMPTKFQDITEYGVIKNVADNMEEDLNKFSNPEKFPKKILLGSLAIGQMNALVLPFTNRDEYIILFQSGLFGFLNLLASVVSLAWPNSKDGTGYSILADPDVIRENILHNRDLKDQFFHILYTTLIEGNPHKMRHFNLNNEQKGFKESILRNAEMFILGHEFGHINRGHFKDRTNVEQKYGEQTINIKNKNWQDEFAADLSGFEYVTAFGTKEPFEFALAYFGVAFFLTCQDIVELALSTFGNNTDTRKGSDTHPSPKLRQQAINEIFRSLAGFKNANFTISAYVDTFDFILYSLWEAVYEDWKMLHKNGEMLHPVWAKSIESFQRDNQPKRSSADLGLFEFFAAIEGQMEQYIPWLTVLLDLFGNDKTKATTAAKELKQGGSSVSILLIFVMLYILTKCGEEKKKVFLDYLFTTCPSLNRPICDFCFVLTRYSYTSNLLLNDEVNIQIFRLKSFLEEYAEAILKGTKPEVMDLYFKSFSDH